MTKTDIAEIERLFRINPSNPRHSRFIYQKNLGIDFEATLLSNFKNRK